MGVGGATVARSFQSTDGGSNPASTLHYHSGFSDEAESLVLEYHYSRRIPSNVQEVFTAHEDGGLFGWRGRCVAACFFTIPAARWKEPLFELARLVRAEDVRVNLSHFVAWATKQMKHRKYDLLVSFADSTHGHHGGIYQACGWNFHGKRDRRMDGLVVNGQFLAGRSCNHDFGTQSPDKLRMEHPSWDVEPHFDDGKYLYWKALNKTGSEKANRLGLERNPYPKPEKTGA